MKKHKKRKNAVIILTLAVFIILCPLSRKLKSGTASFNIPKGSSSVQIAEILKDNGVIRSKTYFLARLYLSPYRKKLQYGTFKIDKNKFVGEFLETLATQGQKKSTIKVTIPEGYSVEKICDTLCETGIITAEEFEDALNQKYNYGFLNCIPKSSDIKYTLQGFLYPSTYEFYTNAKATTIIDKMLSEFEKQIKPLGISEKELFDIVTKASLIEREAKIDSERPIIAGVIENRLSENMPLQIDATVSYAVTNGRYNKEKVTYKDLQSKSGYNTYKNRGLPAGPICSPSIKSIRAAKNPKKHSYLYYHTDTTKNDGSHIFTQTFDEHKKTK